jgi:hypothetical protein
MVQPTPVDTAEAPPIETASRRSINEDWLATIVGLVLLALVLAGVIVKGFVP